MAWAALCGTPEPEGPMRVGVVNGPQTDPSLDMPEPNSIKTAKYQWYNFLGKSLLEQCVLAFGSTVSLTQAA